MKFKYQSNAEQPWVRYTKDTVLEPGVVYITKDLAHARPGVGYNVEDIRYLHLSAQYKNNQYMNHMVLKLYHDTRAVVPHNYSELWLELFKQEVYIRPINPPFPFPTVDL